jgi:surface protein
MEGLFYQTGFNGDISKWNVSNVKNMNGMFYSCDFNKDISKWNVSKVEDMGVSVSRRT